MIVDVELQQAQAAIQEVFSSTQSEPWAGFST